jgi:hypothetical protein
MPDIELLQMALVGYRSERERMQEKIDELEHRLGGYKVVASDRHGPTKKRRKMSAAALARIRTGQLKRWAAYRKQRGAKAAAKKAPKRTSAKNAAPKRKMSPARKTALLANLAKARAARAAKQGTA